MRQRKRMALRPQLETMESRALLSGIMAVLATDTPVPQITAASLAETASATPGPLQPNGFPAGSSTPLLGQGTPTPQELARERFNATFAGPVTVGPGRFSDQAKIIYIRGVGGSNMFLHGDLQLAVVDPTNPNAPLTGEAVLQDKNNNSSGIIGLVLSGSARNVDRLGRPTQLTFTADPSINSGIFFVNSSIGTVHIRYSKVSAIATFQGLVYTSGLTNPLENTDLFARGGRISPRSGR